MAPINVLAVIALLVIMTLAGIEAQRQRMKLMTGGDGGALCATNKPTVSVKMSPAMPEAPGAVRCAICLLYTSPSPRDRQKSRMPSSA